MPTLPTPEIRSDDDLAADWLTAAGGARGTANVGRIERRRSRPNPGWYAIPARGDASGPYPSAAAAGRALR